MKLIQLQNRTYIMDSASLENYTSVHQDMIFTLRHA